jgi:outer membrane protein
MRSAATAFALLLLLAATPVLAQGRPVEWTLWGSWVSPQGSNDLGDFSIETDSGVGAGLSANFFITDRLSTEVGVSWLSADAEMSFEGIVFDMDAVEMIPVTAGLQYHFVRESRWDPYVGAGVAWVSAADIQSSDLDELGVGALDLDDEFSWFANGGVGYRFGDQFGLALDVRYVDYAPTATSKATGGVEELEFSPLVTSLGLRVRF